MPVYLDYNATTPVDPEVLEAMLPWFSEKFGNASSSSHAWGWQAAEAVKISREKVAALIGADRTEIIFTSGATEAINLALTGAYRRYSSTKGNHIVTIATEHQAVLETISSLRSEGAEITILPVEKNGSIDLDNLANHLRPDTVLRSVRWANNETGVVHDIEKISRIAKGKSVLFFSDATQAAGKIPVDVNLGEGLDLLAFSSHKLYGPKGCGALYMRRRNPRVSIEAIQHGGGQENGVRSGTLNVPGIVGFGKAAEISLRKMTEESKRLKLLRDELEKSLLTVSHSRVNGAGGKRLPNTLNLCFPGIPAEKIISGLRGLAFSTGSACSSAVMEPSHVLLAMGLSEDEAFSSIRISLGRFTTETEIRETAREFAEFLSKCLPNHPKKH